jgi:hypothetical protein
VLWLVAFVALGALVIVVLLSTSSGEPSSGPTETAPAVQPDEPTPEPEPPAEPTEPPEPRSTASP